MALPAVFPFYIAHFRAEEAQRLCSAFIDAKTDGFSALPEEMQPTPLKITPARIFFSLQTLRMDSIRSAPRFSRMQWQIISPLPVIK
jgi:hypothetical protein